MERLESSVFKYAFDVAIEAPPATVWRLLTTDIGSWWLKDFNSSPDTKSFRLEPKVGGRMFEDQGDDNGVLWGTVVQCDPPNRLQIQGAMFPDYGGPGTYHLSCQIEPTASGCVLKVTDAMFGYVSEEQVNSTKEGWELLFGTHLKEAAEKASP